LERQGLRCFVAIFWEDLAPHPYFTKNNVLAWVYSRAVSRYM